MHEVRKLKDHAMVLEAQQLLRASAAQDLAEAQSHERRRRDDEEKARTSVQQALESWQACLDASPIDPDRLGELSVSLAYRDAQLRAARKSVELAAQRTEASQRRHAECDVRNRQTDAGLQRLRRRAGQRDAERRMSTLEDRLTYLCVKT